MNLCIAGKCMRERARKFVTIPNSLAFYQIKLTLGKKINLKKIIL